MKTAMFGIGCMLLVAIAPAAADDTAKAGLAQALQLAAKWQKDANLEAISTPLADGNGNSRLWQYSFHSPKAGKCVRVQIIKGMPPNVIDLGSCIPNKPIPKEFVDSPAAMQQARKAGFQLDSDDNSMLLSISKDKLAKGKACWAVSSVKDFDPKKSVKRGWCVDAKTGTFLIRLSGEM